jgi:hypothetical protein
LKTVISLVLKDLRRDWKRPWSLLLFASLPLLMTGLMASIFAGGGKGTTMPAIQVEVLDQDKDMFADALRSMSGQGDAAKQLRLHFVDKLEDGLLVLEKRKASALVVLPKNMTEDLLSGKTNTIDLYENPAEQVLPKVVRQGVLLLATGLSGAAEVFHEPLTTIREMFLATNFPSDLAVLGLAAQSLQKLRQVRTCLFPPLIQFKTVNAGDYQPETTNAVATPKPL